MSYDRDQFLDTVAKNREAVTRAALPQAQALHAAAVSQEHLTRDAHWDRYLSLLQGMRDKIQTRKQQAELKQSDRSIWDAKDLFKLKSDVIEADAMLGLMDTIMGLPKALMEGGERAQALIAKYENDESTATTNP